jgi:hypothetical protein
MATEEEIEAIEDGIEVIIDIALEEGVEPRTICEILDSAHGDVYQMID